MPSSSRNLRKRPARNSSPPNEQQSSPDAKSSATRDASPVTKPLREKQQATLDPWIEPVIPRAKPSFEEYGLQRGGVVQNMQPLGIKPSAKLKARLKKEASRGPRRSYQAALSGDEGMRDTPDTTLSGLQTRDPSEPLEDTMDDIMDDVPLPTHEAEDDDDYAPKSSKRLSAACGKGTAINGNSDASNHKEYTDRVQNFDAIKHRTNSVDDRAVGRSGERKGFANRATSRDPLIDEKTVRCRIFEDNRDPSEDLNGNSWDRSSRTSGSRRSRGPSLAADRRKRRRTSSSPVPEKSPTPPRKTRSKATATPSNMISNSVPSSSQPSGADTAATTVLSESNTSPAPPADSTSPISTPTIKTPSVRTTRSRAVVSHSANSAPPSKRSKLANATHDTDSELSDVNEEIAQGPPPEQLAASDSRQESVAASRSRHSSRQPTNLKLKLSTGRRIKRSSEEAGITPEEETEREVKRTKLLRKFDNASFPMSDVRHKGGRENSPASSFLSSRSPTPPSPPPRGSTTHRSSHRLHPERDLHLRGGVRQGTAPTNGVGDSVDHGDSDHDNECSACGGGGASTSCKGCHRSFHNTCWDPPLDGPPDQPILCNSCEAGFDSPVDHEFSIMGPLLSLIEKSNPDAFVLPDQIRGYFEDVQAGTDGEYVETGVWEDVKAKNGWVEPDDTTRLIDKGEVLLCCYCGEAARPDRGIIKCDITGCDALWHLDCIDPPLANPPARNEEKTKRRLFKCPRHVFHDFRQLRSRKLVSREGGAEPERQSYRLRIPRRQSFVAALAPRGRRNNGLIEIATDSSSEEEFYEDDRPDGAVDKYPAKAIKLDFIEKAKEHAFKLQKQRFNAAIDRVVAIEESIAANAVNELSRHSFRDSQAALHLAQLSQNGTGFKHSSGVSGLIMALTSEAPENIASDITRQQRSLERADLEELKKLIAAREAQLNEEDAAEHAPLEPMPDDPMAEIIKIEPVSGGSPAMDSSIMYSTGLEHTATDSLMEDELSELDAAADDTLTSGSTMMDLSAMGSSMLGLHETESILVDSPALGSADVVAVVTDIPANAASTARGIVGVDFTADTLTTDPSVTETSITEPSPSKTPAIFVSEIDDSVLDPSLTEPLVDVSNIRITAVEPISPAVVAADSPALKPMEPISLDVATVELPIVDTIMTEPTVIETTTNEGRLVEAISIPLGPDLPATRSISEQSMTEPTIGELSSIESLVDTVIADATSEIVPSWPLEDEPATVGIISAQSSVTEPLAIDLPALTPPPLEIPNLESSQNPAKYADVIQRPLESLNIEHSIIEPTFQYSTTTPPEEPVTEAPVPDSDVIEPSPVDSFAIKPHSKESPSLTPPTEDLPIHESSIIDSHPSKAAISQSVPVGSASIDISADEPLVGSNFIPGPADPDSQLSSTTPTAIADSMVNSLS